MMAPSPFRFTGRRCRRALALLVLLAALPLLPATARANGGGGGDKPPCIWEKDLTFEIDGHEIVVTQEAVKNGRTMENAGYFVRPDPRGLFLFVRAPDGMLYRTGLTVLELGKGRDKCQAFYAGRLTAASGNHF